MALTLADEKIGCISCLAKTNPQNQDLMWNCLPLFIGHPLIRWFGRQEKTTPKINSGAGEPWGKSAQPYMSQSEYWNVVTWGPPENLAATCLNCCKTQGVWLRELKFWLGMIQRRQILFTEHESSGWRSLRTQIFIHYFTHKMNFKKHCIFYNGQGILLCIVAVVCCLYALLSNVVVVHSCCCLHCCHMLLFLLCIVFVT